MTVNLLFPRRIEDWRNTTIKTIENHIGYYITGEIWDNIDRPMWDIVIRIEKEIQGWNT